MKRFLIQKKETPQSLINLDFSFFWLETLINENHLPLSHLGKKVHVGLGARWYREDHGLYCICSAIYYRSCSLALIIMIKTG
jgi:hypothetical protein